MKRYYSWSGGVDSSASLLLGKYLDIDCDGVLFSEVMFSHDESISAENPIHINWVYDSAIPFVESLGYKVIIVKSDKDFLDYFYKVRTHRSKYCGKLVGFPMVGSGCCEIKVPLKIKPIQDFLRLHDEPVETIVGICADESHRFSILNNTKRSILKENSITHKDCFSICSSNSLLSPFYKGANRQGCWFCPNQSIRSFAKLAVDFPNLYNRMLSLFNTPNLISYEIHPGLSFNDFIDSVNRINCQEHLFDYIDSLDIFGRYHE